jgi:hypothetical protein
MRPPIPSPAARDCPHCGAPVNDAHLSFCPRCGAALKTSARYATTTIIGAILLGIVCVPMGACSIYAIGDSLIAPDSSGFSSVVIFFAAICLAMAGAGIWGLINMLRRR